MTEIKTNFEIRQAEEEDVPEILELIKALAELRISLMKLLQQRSC